MVSVGIDVRLSTMLLTIGLTFDGIATAKPKVLITRIASWPRAHICFQAFKPNEVTPLNGFFRRRRNSAFRQTKPVNLTDNGILGDI